MFKENQSRFSVLLDNASSSEKKSSNNSNNNININRNQNMDRPNRDYYRKSNNLFSGSHNVVIPSKKEFSYADEMFPSLTDNTIEVKEDVQTQNFMDKLLTEKKVDSNDDTWILPDGWVKITKDKETSSLTYNYGKNMKHDKMPTLFDICEELACKYEKWEEEYIDKWGKDEYEKMYKFPNYDYYYFDNLDEKYYEQSDDENDNDEEYVDSYDEYSDYY